jgi:hypothetical protein
MTRIGLLPEPPFQPRFLKAIMRKSPALTRHRSRTEKLQGASRVILPVFGLAVGGLIAAGFSKLPLETDPDSPLLTHVASRYFERSALETGQSHPALAVFGDYRSLDLAILSLLWLAATLVFFLKEPKLGGGKKKASSPKGLLCLIGPGLVWGLGLLCLAGGSNFLDYESLPFPFAPSQIRVAGGFLAVLGVLFAAVFFIHAFITKGRWLGDSEK